MDLFVFEEDSIELASQKWRRTPLFTCISGISTHYPIPYLRTLHAGSQLTNHCDTNSRFSGPASPFNPFFINTYHAHMNALTCPSNSRRSPGCKNQSNRSRICSGVDYASPIAVRTTPGQEYKSYRKRPILRYLYASRPQPYI